MIYEDEEEYYGEDNGIHPDLTKFIDLFNRVSEIQIEYCTERTNLVIKLDDGTWSFFCFYDVGERDINKEDHSKLVKSFEYYLGEMK